VWYNQTRRITNTFMSPGGSMYIFKRVFSITLLLVSLTSCASPSGGIGIRVPNTSGSMISNTCAEWGRAYIFTRGNVLVDSMEFAAAPAQFFFRHNFFNQASTANVVVQLFDGTTFIDDFSFVLRTDTPYTLRLKKLERGSYYGGYGSARIVRGNHCFSVTEAGAPQRSSGLLGIGIGVSTGSARRHGRPAW